MRKINIRELLGELGVSVDSIVLGDFDAIGELAARKPRGPNSEHYKLGKFFRPNYERGILVYYLIRKFKLKSFIELGTGRGYTTLCAGKAFCDEGIDGKIVTIDADISEDYLNALLKNFSAEWYKNTEFIRGLTNNVLSNIEESFDLVYIDAAHDYLSVNKDWEWSKSHFNKFVLFDDYIEGHKDGFGVRDVVDNIDNCDEYKMDYIIGDRRIFIDDRKLSDDEINYGQVLVHNKP
jgi:predicted O-methyltransferase YrrM